MWLCAADNSPLGGPRRHGRNRLSGDADHGGLDAFDGVPTARPGGLVLRIRHRDRHLARAMVEAIEEARVDALEYTDPGLLDDGETPRRGTTFP